MPGCGEEVPDIVDINVDMGKLARESTSGPHDEILEDTNKPFVRDMTYEQLEELIEKCVRRVLQGDDINREYAKLRATEKSK